MIDGPLKGLIGLAAHVPSIWRPAFVFTVLALAVILLFPNGWLKRIIAALLAIIATLAGLLVLAEYAVTSGRRARGRGPLSPVVGVSRVASGAGPAAASAVAKLWRRPKGRWRVGRIAIVLGMVIVVTGVIPSLVLKGSPDSGTTLQIYSGFDHWSDLENWAGVDPSERVSLLSIEPDPSLRGTKRFVLLSCGASRSSSHYRIVGRLSRTSRVGDVLSEGNTDARGLARVALSNRNRKDWRVGQAFRVTCGSTTRVIALL